MLRRKKKTSNEKGFTEINDISSLDDLWPDDSINDAEDPRRMCLISIF